MCGRDIELDVTKNIRTIEKLKSDLLSDVSDLFKNLADGKNNPSDRDDILADIVISAYLLSNRLNTDPKVLNKKMSEKLRLKVLDNGNELYNDYSILLKSLGVAVRNDTKF